MKKILFVALAAVGAFAISSCHNAKSNDPVQQAAAELTDSIKEQAMLLFEAIQADQKTLVESVQALSEQTRTIPAKFFMPLSAADNAQTLEQKCALLGCYIVDSQTEKLVYGGIGNAERNTVIARLAADANLQSKGDLNDTEMTAEELNKKIQALSLADFEAALENDDADNQVIVLVYSIMEATLNNQAVYEMNNGLIDNIAIAEQYAPCAPMFANMVALVELLAPHYDSLEFILPVTEKVGAILNAADEDAKMLAIMDYNGYIQEMRGKLNVAVDADK